VSWHFLQGQEAACWPHACLDGAPYVLSKLIPTVSNGCLTDSGMGVCRDSQCGTTFAHSTGAPGADTSMSLAEDSHARISVRRVKVLELPDHVLDLSSKCSELLMKFGLRLCSRKTVRSFVPRGWPQSSRDLSAWGIWDESGYWELGTSVQTMSASECGSLPSPRASDADRGGRGDLLQALRGNSNSHFSVKVPTPRANKWGLEDSHGSVSGWEGVLEMLPTPTAKLYGNNRGGSAGRVGKVRPSLESLTGGVYPALREWMMGWPIGWTALGPLATDRFREWLRSFGACSQVISPLLTRREPFNSRETVNTDINNDDNLEDG